MSVKKNRIGYDFTSENNVFSTFNALLNEENKESYSIPSIKETQDAINLAHATFKNYRLTSTETRSNFLRSIAAELENNRQELIQMYCKESSLSSTRGNNELDRTIFQLNSFADYILQKDWNRPIETNPINSPFTISASFQAIGPVAVFGSSNFPFAYSTAGGDTAAALAAGCPVIVKAHPMHAGTSYLVSECIVKASFDNNLPNGVFSHLMDSGHEVGVELTQNEFIKAIGFTGSIKGGRALMDISSKRNAPIPVFAEMGSLNPVIFFESELDKNLELWVDKFTSSISTDGGQFCTKPGILFIPNSVMGNKFISELELQLSLTEPKCHLHPRLFESFKNQVEESFNWIKCSLPNHSQPVLRIVTSFDFLNDYNYYEEFFGPQSIAVTYDSIEELDEMFEKLSGQLTTTFIGSEDEFHSHIDLIEKSSEKSGRIIFNGVPTGVTVTDSMVHSGTYPASSDSRFTAVGTQSIYRFLRPVSKQKTRNV